MSYATGEAAILTLAQALAQWDADNSISLANDTKNRGASLLNTGNSDIYLILRPGEFERDNSDIAVTRMHTTWQTRATIAVLIRADGNSAEKKLVDARNTLINALDARRTLNSASGVLWAMVTGGGEIDNLTAAEARQFITQELSIEWLEETSVTQND